MMQQESATIRALSPLEMETINPFLKVCREHIALKQMQGKYSGLKIRETFPLWGNEINL